MIVSSSTLPIQLDFSIPQIVSEKSKDRIEVKLHPQIFREEMAGDLEVQEDYM